MLDSTQHTALLTEAFEQYLERNPAAKEGLMNATGGNPTGVTQFVASLATNGVMPTTSEWKIEAIVIAAGRGMSYADIGKQLDVSASYVGKVLKERKQADARAVPVQAPVPPVMQSQPAPATEPVAAPVAEPVAAPQPEPAPAPQPEPAPAPQPEPVVEVVPGAPVDWPTPAQLAAVGVTVAQFDALPDEFKQQVTDFIKANVPAPQPEPVAAPRPEPVAAPQPEPAPAPAPAPVQPQPAPQFVPPAGEPVAAPAAPSTAATAGHTPPAGQPEPQMQVPGEHYQPSEASASIADIAARLAAAKG